MQLSDAELVTLAEHAGPLGFASEARWLRHARAHLRTVPVSAAAAGLQRAAARRRIADPALHPRLAADTSVWTDDVWVVDSTPVECGRSRETARRLSWPDGQSTATAPAIALLLGPAAAPGSAPCTACPSPSPCPERKQTSARSWWTCSNADADLTAARPGQISSATRTTTAVTSKPPWPRPGSPAAPGPQRRARPGRARFFEPLRQIIESINDTFKGQLDLERHGGHTPEGVIVRVLQRILALTAAIWHNDRTASPSSAHSWPTTTDPLE